MFNFSFAAQKPIDGEVGRADIPLIVSVILLWGLGLFALYTCSSDYAHRLFGDGLYFVKSQLLNSIAAIISLLLFTFINMRLLRKLLPFFVLGCLLLCLMTFMPGIGAMRNGAYRWISLPLLGTFQPSELAKFAVVLFLANFFDKQAQYPEGERIIYPAIVGLGIIVIVILFQRDFSTAFFVMLIGVFMFFVTNTKIIRFIPFCILALLFVGLFIFTEPFRVQRLISFINPDYSPMGWNYQARVAQRAITAGGFWGAGAGTGLVYSAGIPEIHTDYIFAGWAEAMGLLGVAAYFALLFFFAFRGFRVSAQADDLFVSVSGLGCTAVILFQSLMNCGVVCGAFPSTGIPLPFFSSGGSSLLATMSMCGFLINISRTRSEVGS